MVLDNLRKIHDPSSRQLRIQPVWPPTEVPWLNLIEAQFSVLTHIGLTNKDDTNDARRGVAASTLVAATDTATSRTYILALDRVRSLRSIKLEPYPSVLVGCPSLVPTTPAHDCSAGAARVRRDGTSDRVACAGRWPDQPENSRPFSSSSVYRPRSTRILRIRCVSGLR